MPATPERVWAAIQAGEGGGGDDPGRVRLRPGRLGRRGRRPARRARRRGQAARRRPLAAAADEAAAGAAVGARRRRPAARPVLRPRRRRPRRRSARSPATTTSSTPTCCRPRCRSWPTSAGQVGDPQVRHRGTIGGSLAHGDPASDLPAVLLALRRHAGRPGPGRRARDRGRPTSSPGFLETALAPDELLTEIRVPKVPGAGWSFQKFNRRAQDWAIVGVAAVAATARTGVGAGEHGLDAAAGHGGRARRSAGGASARRRGRHAADEGTEPPADLNASAGVPPPPGPGPRAPGPRGGGRLTIGMMPGCVDGATARRRGGRAPRLAEHDYLADEGLATAVFLALRCSGRCCSRARPASARPRWPRCWPAGPAASCSASSATRASTSPRPSTSGTTPASCSTSGPPRRRAAGRWPSVEDELYAERFLVRRPLLRAIDHAGDGAAAGAAHRRGRPGRRRVRGLPARDPVRLRGHRPRARHVPGRGAAGRRASPRTAPATCTTPSSAAASTTGSSTPTSSARWPSCGCGRPACPSALARQVAGGGRGASGRCELYKPPGVAETIDWAAGARRPRAAPTLDEARGRRHARHGAQVPRGPGAGARPAASAELVAGAPVLPGRPMAPRPSGWPSPSPASCGGAGLDVPVGAVVDVRRGARRGRRRPAATASTGPAGPRSCAGPRTSPPTTGPSPPSGGGRGRADAADRRAGRADRRPRHRRRRRRRRRRGRRAEPTGRRWSCAGAASEVLRHKDFAACTHDELAEARRLMADLRSAGALRRSRRRRPTAAGRGPARPAPHRAARAAHRRRAAPARAYRAPASGPGGSCCCCDVSGSMEPYARALVRFAHAAVVGRRPVEAFALGTRLTRLTRELSSPRPRRRPRRGGPRRSPTGRAAPASATGCGAFNDQLGRAGHGPRRGRRDPLRRLGPRRPDAARPSRWPACAGWPTGWCGSTRSRRRRATRRWPQGMAAALPVRRRVRRGPLARRPCEQLAEVMRTTMKEICCDDLDRWRARGQAGRPGPGRRRRGLGPPRPGRGHGRQRGRRGGRLGVGRLRRGRGGHRGARRARAGGTPALVTFGYSDDEAFAVGPHLRRHDPPLRRAAATGESTSTIFEALRDRGRDRSRWPPSSTARTPGAKLLVRPGRRRRSASLGDPDLDRVVARDALGELAAGPHRRSATTAPTARPAEDERRGLHRVVRPAAPDADLRRRRLHRRPRPGGQGARLPRHGVRRPRGVRHQGALPDGRRGRRRLARPPTSRGSAPSSGPATRCACSPTTPSSTCPPSSPRSSTEVGYLGAMGSRRTHDERIGRLRGGRRRRRRRSPGSWRPSGSTSAPARPRRRRSPICAEIIASRTGRAAPSLRDTDGPIHKR